MNAQANILRNAVEAKRQELIKELASAGYIDLSDGRTLQELSLFELQDMQRNASSDSKR